MPSRVGASCVAKPLMLLAVEFGRVYFLFWRIISAMTRPIAAPIGPKMKGLIQAGSGLGYEKKHMPTNQPKKAPAAIQAAMPKHPHRFPSGLSVWSMPSPQQLAREFSEDA